LVPPHAGAYAGDTKAERSPAHHHQNGKDKDVQIDVGLVDITVFFHVPPGISPTLPTTPEERHRACEENFRHFDSVCSGGLHDQMIIASVAHLFDSDGTPSFH
jgi:hypothetical protein